MYIDVDDVYKKLKKLETRKTMLVERRQVLIPYL